MNKLHITAADIANGRIKNEERLTHYEGDVVIGSDVGLVNIPAAKIASRWWFSTAARCPSAARWPLAAI
jgi:hypothetical protein